MDQLTVFITCAIAAVGMYLLLAMQSRAGRFVGIIVGLAALAWLAIKLIGTGEIDGSPVPAAGDMPQPLFYVFALIAIGAGARMITHDRPVYCALYFVMVVMSSASIFLLLEAEFMAFALIIVYAGAILITYLFVLMLAQQAPTESEGEVTPEYDRVPHEPASAVAVGFLMLALIGQVVFQQPNAMPPQPGNAERLAAIAENVNIMDKKRDAIIAAFSVDGVDLPEDVIVGEIREDRIIFIQQTNNVPREVTFLQAGLTREEVMDLMPENIEEVGLALVYKFPVSLELAGVILLMAMFGAVVLARKQIELGEEEQRQAAGMQRLTEDADEGGSA